MNNFLDAIISLLHLWLKINTRVPDGTHDACLLLNIGLFKKIVTGECLQYKTLRNTVLLDK